MSHTKREYDKNGNLIYRKFPKDNYEYRCEYDENNNRIYFEDNKGYKCCCNDEKEGKSWYKENKYITDEEVIFEKYGYCSICGECGRLTKTHILPRSILPPGTRGNTYFLECSDCNEKLGANIDFHLTNLLQFYKIRRMRNVLLKNDIINKNYINYIRLQKNELLDNKKVVKSIESNLINGNIKLGSRKRKSRSRRSRKSKPEKEININRVISLKKEVNINACYLSLLHSLVLSYKIIGSEFPMMKEIIDLLVLCKNETISFVPISEENFINITDESFTVSKFIFKEGNRFKFGGRFNVNYFDILVVFYYKEGKQNIFLFSKGASKKDINDFIVFIEQEVKGKLDINLIEVNSPYLSQFDQKIMST